MEPIPVNQRSPQLKDSVRAFVGITLELLSKEPEARRDFPDLFSDIARYWFIDETEDEDFIQKVKSKFFRLGFTGQLVREKIEAIFREDRHLSACCATPWLLCVLLGRFFVNTTAVEFHERGQFDDDVFDQTFDALEKEIYRQPLKITLFSHLFNFSAEADEYEFAESTIRRLSSWDVRSILDNIVLAQVYHPGGVGDYFILTPIIGDTTDPQKFWEHVFAEIEKLDDAVGVFRYLKDGVVYRDYSFLDFEPPWVKHLHPSLPLGQPHGVPYAEGKRLYTLESADLARATDWLRLFRSSLVQAPLSDKKSDLVKSLRVAMEFFASSFSEKGPEQRLIHLMVALEAMFSPGDKEELNFRIRQYASQLIGLDSSDRASIFSFLKRIYKTRSKLVHGSLDIDSYLQDAFIKDEEIEELSSIVRRSILRLLALLLSGRKNLRDGNKADPIHSEIEMGCLDNRIRDKLLAESDTDLVTKSLISKIDEENTSK